MLGLPWKTRREERGGETEDDHVKKSSECSGHFAPTTVLFPAVGRKLDCLCDESICAWILLPPNTPHAHTYFASRFGILHLFI